ncbi:MAG: GNAT family N-acetyltransferase [Atopobiaceae bacterium]|nr:GNAT family N-acetyltransferase [Atopobiaceae bacterium]
MGIDARRDGTEEGRGKSYGKALLKKLSSIAVKRGCGRLKWLCLDWNQPGGDVYLSLGLSQWMIGRIVAWPVRH